MNKVLVVIDNIFQYEKIKKIVLSKNLQDFFDFRHSIVKSAIWDHIDFQNKKDSIIDVNNCIEYIVKNYYLVLSVHCFQFFPKELVTRVKCINVHPGYNPINRGWYPQVFSIIYNLPIGATIHEMDEKLDNGPIIDRKFVEKYLWDTSITIYNRVLDAEIELFEKNFDAIISNSYDKIIPENRGNMFRKSDFMKLCEIDLEQVGTFKSFYDKLRALSHGEYKNAYFIDDETQKKVFIKIDIEVDNS
jgi:methionyl-tRNA formyltransferase